MALGMITMGVDTVVVDTEVMEADMITQAMEVTVATVNTLSLIFVLVPINIVECWVYVESFSK